MLPLLARKGDFHEVGGGDLEALQRILGQGRLVPTRCVYLCVYVCERVCVVSVGVFVWVCVGVFVWGGCVCVCVCVCVHVGVVSVRVDVCGQCREGAITRR